MWDAFCKTLLAAVAATEELMQDVKNKLMKPLHDQLEHGKIGYAILWLLGVPLPVLALFYFLRH